MTNKLLEVKDLKTEFKTSKGLLTAVNNVSFHVDRGETVCIVGESGCGKSITALSIMGLLPKNGVIPSGNIYFQEQDLTLLSKEQMRKIRGKDISMIFQEPMTALNPVFTIGFQLREALLTHKEMSKAQAQKEGIRLLEQVGIPSPRER